MPIQDYGVWVGFPRSFKAQRKEDDPVSPHITLYYEESKSASTPDGTEETDFNAAINVKSTSNDSRLVYWINRRFEDEAVIQRLAALSAGFHGLPSKDRQGLDYIRGNLLDISKGILVEHDRDGGNNDIIDYISPILRQSIKHQAKIFLFGSPYTRGGKGIHNIHMNQGNIDPRFVKDNGVYQDGGLIISFPDGHWEAIFLAFASQKIHTDNKTGDALTETDFAKLLTPFDNPVGPPTLNENYGKVVITAALIDAINTPGPDGNLNDEKEHVFLENRSLKDINLDNWTLSNKQNQKQALSGVIKSGGRRIVEVPNAPLSNKGGLITLLDEEGLKVHGVSYSSAQVAREGELVYFTSGPL